METSKLNPFITGQKALVCLMTSSLLLAACDKNTNQRTRPAQVAQGAATIENHDQQKNADGTPNTNNKGTTNNNNPGNGNTKPEDSTTDKPQMKGTLQTGTEDNSNGQTTNVDGNPPNSLNPPGPQAGGTIPPPSGQPNPSGNTNLPNNPSLPDSRTGSTKSVDLVLEDSDSSTSRSDRKLNQKSRFTKSSSSSRDSIDEGSDTDDDRLLAEDQDEDEKDDKDSKKSNDGSKLSKHSKTKDFHRIDLMLKQMNKIYLNAWIAINHDSTSKPENYFSLVHKKIHDYKLYVFNESEPIKDFDDKKECDRFKLILQKYDSGNTYFIYQVPCNSNNYDDHPPILVFSKESDGEWILKPSNVKAYKKLLTDKRIGKEPDSASNPRCKIEMKKGNSEKQLVTLARCENFFQIYKPSKEKNGEKESRIHNLQFIFEKGSEDHEIVVQGIKSEDSSEPNTNQCLKTKVKTFKDSLYPNIDENDLKTEDISECEKKLTISYLKSYKSTSSRMIASSPQSVKAIQYSPTLKKKALPQFQLINQLPPM